MLCMMGHGAVTHRLLQADGQVDHGHIGGGDAEGHASDLTGAQTSDRITHLTQILCFCMLYQPPNIVHEWVARASLVLTR